MKKSVCLVTGGLMTDNLRLQPWRYLFEVARQLATQGHSVTVLSDGVGEPPAGELHGGLTLVRLPTISNPRWRPNLVLRRTIRELAPEVILWHVGLTSFWHQRWDVAGPTAVAGIFTTPIYDKRELWQVGIGKLVGGYRLSTLHVIGALLPTPVRAVQNRLRHLVVQTETTKRQLTARGWSPARIQLIPPGVDDIWRQPELNDGNKIRVELGYGRSDIVIVYFSSPAPIRGLHTLIEAVDLARRTGLSLKLLVLSRRHKDELLGEDAALNRQLSRKRINQYVQVVSGRLPPDRLVRHVAAADVVALPFALVPSDAPLSLLEAQALGKPLVTTDVACLPELAAKGTGYLAKPADPHSLADALRQAVANLRARHDKPPYLPIRNWAQVGEEWSHYVQGL